MTEMRCVSRCKECHGKNFDYVDVVRDGKVKSFERGFCYDCNKEVSIIDIFLDSPGERARNEVYATGNKWAIENFNATHN